MEKITNETRKESYKKLDIKVKTKLIYDELDRDYTARELAKKLNQKRFNKNCRKTRNSSSIDRISKDESSKSC